MDRERVRWQNPHIISTVRTDAGERWRIEAAAINTLERQGVSRDALTEGERVHVIGAASRRGRQEMFGALATFADGREITLAGGIAVELGLLERGLLTDDDAAAEVDSAGGIFRVWSRAYPEGYPLPPPEGLPFTAAALAAQAEWDPLVDDTGLSCIPQGMPGVIVNPYPIQFIERDGDIELRIEEWDTVRTIHMSGDVEPAERATPLGYSVGRWEDETLVVETTKISWPYYDDIGTPQTEAMVVEERFTPSTDSTRLDYTQTAFDPVTFTAPAVLSGYFWQVTGDEIKPFECERERPE